MKQKIRNLFTGQIPVAIVFILLGLCLIAMPSSTLTVLCKVFFGIALILSGIYQVVRYVLNNQTEYGSAINLYTGVITLVMGMFLFSNPAVVVKLLPWMLSGFIVADCIWLVQGTLTMKKLNIAMWQVVLGVAAVFAILALILFFNPFSQVRTMLAYAGWLFLIKGILDILLYLQISKKVAAATPAQEPKKANTFAVANLEPQRPSAPDFLQRAAQKRSERKAQREAARAEAKAREEAEKAQAAADAAAQAQAESQAVKPEDEAVDGDYIQTEATPEGEEASAPEDVIDVSVINETPVGEEYQEEYSVDDELEQ